MGYFNSAITSPDAMLEIAHRRDPGAQAVDLFGFNRSIGTTYETVFNNGGGIYQFPSEMVTLSCVSTSAADTMSILIQGLNTDYEVINDVVTLSGTTPVASNIQFYRINSAVILSGTNAGAISITNNATVHAYIEAELGSDQGLIYTVPADHSLYIFTAQFTSGTVNPNKYLFSRALTRSSTGRQVRFWEATFATNVNYSLVRPFRVPPKTDFTIEAKSSSSENELSIYLNAVLMEEDL